MQLKRKKLGLVRDSKDSRRERALTRAMEGEEGEDEEDEETPLVRKGKKMAAP